MKKNALFALFTVIFILFTAFTLTGCGGGTPADTSAQSTAEETVPETDPPEIVICENGSSRYRLLVPGGCSSTVKDGAVDLMTEIGFRLNGMALTYDNDPNPAPEGVRDIIVGKADRPAVKEAAAKIIMPHDFIIYAASDGTIVIYSENEGQIAEGCRAFAAMMKADGSRKTIPGGDYYHSYEYPAAGLRICGADVKEYSIIVPDGAQSELEAAEKIRDMIYESTGYNLPVTSASGSSSDREILVGNTTRTEDDRYYAGSDALTGGEFAIETAGNRLICAFSSSGRRQMLDRLSGLISGKNVENLSLREKNSAILPSLDGKTVLFLGNSHTYYGGNVTTTRGPSTRDSGWFFQIAKSFGEKVSVINMTYPGEKFTDLYPRLTSQKPEWFEKIDVVIMQQAGTANDETALTYARKIRDLFPEDTVFAYIISEYCVRNNQTYTLNAAETLKEEGMLVADWGHTAWDLMDGKVPGMTHEYVKTTFRVNKNDTFHPNTLSGYITAITCYATVTGKKMEGTPYSFITDSYLKSFISEYYTSAGDTNIIEIFHDEEEMKRIQAIVDRRVAEVNGR